MICLFSHPVLCKRRDVSCLYPRNMIARNPDGFFYMVRKIKMSCNKYGKTRGLMLRTDQAEALRIASAATGKSENAFLVEIIRERIEKEKTMKGEPDGQNKIL